MSTGRDRVLQILNELEGSESETSHMTASEVAAVLLSSEHVDESPKPDSSFPVEEQNLGEIVEMETLDDSLRDVNRTWKLLYYRPILSARPIIAGLIVFFRRLFRRAARFLIEPLTEAQTEFNSSVARSLNTIRNHDVVFEAYIRRMDNELTQRKSLLEQLHTEYQEALRSERELFEQRVFQLEQKMWEKSDNLYGEIDYFDFENHFRGNRSQIAERQKMYIDYFKDCKHVIDLGSGRGEFLDLLKQQRIPAVGVDLYGPFVDFCRMHGQEVVQEDAVSYLRRQENDCCDGIFAGQLIEHLNTKELISLCSDSYRTLKKGGTLIVETPNPTCVATYLNSFYLDPSHVKPVHPKTVEYFLRKAGFQEIRIIFTEQSKVGYRFPLLSAEGGNLEEFNDGVNFLSDIIFGSQDYAVIAVK